ncbi:contractile injection system protein, VgrG/Pvc8 family [Alteromonas sp. a30]|uniref:contractile injection system protein, VgrG/Pvc8 family n=1 Tax=Alteromonas sp. a30 TaxID=2730917 RepID=UPI00227E43AD|nr:contractile injection system protein, VgrG/Pvc8 family [Alteromonas sp. a30]MCY7295088.1 hypothetical protein [Alteromonas sp. a30]
MKPIFSIIANSQDITQKLQRNLVSIEVTDVMSPNSDSVRITLADVEAKLGVINVGMELEVSMGYEEGEGRKRLYRVGRFVLDEIGVSGPPTQVTLVGRSTNFIDTLKNYRNQSFDNTTLGEIARSIITSNGFTARIAPEIDQIQIEHIDQADESDLHFLSRLAQTYDALLKPSIREVILAPADAGETASGAQIESKPIHVSQLSRWSLELPKRTDYGCVKAYWRSDEQGERQVEMLGDESETCKVLKSTFLTQKEAKAAINSEKQRLDRELRNIHFTLPGDPELFAERPIRISGVHPLADGDFICKRVTHTLSSSGFVTSVKAQ